ncbi:hypothetical protein SMD44_p10073 (plasmid) [Streptomyces alboflavus]|uniref:Uncharacterized protein n=1 Tax=Streptomyces alboflavus TaxID=67267 RepID=A0A291W4U9_9ACTN|nr:hypothetical protein [Streptomyces alboflavus]ATM24572.1 hypothetical protein SMD44_p10073 [Streptomyces alboflavus]
MLLPRSHPAPVDRSGTPAARRPQPRSSAPGRCAVEPVRVTVTASAAARLTASRAGRVLPHPPGAPTALLTKDTS